METSFLELRCKEVINIVDGRLLGHIVDIVFNIKTSQITGVVVPGAKSFFSVFKPPQEIFIPYRNICKIGEDVILVELYNLPPIKKNKNVAIASAKESVNHELDHIKPKDNLQDIKNKISGDI